MILFEQCIYVYGIGGKRIYTVSAMFCGLCRLPSADDYRTHSTYVSDIFFSYCQANKYNIFILNYDNIQFEHSIRCIGPVTRVEYVIYDSSCNQNGCHYSIKNCWNPR